MSDTPAVRGVVIAHGEMAIGLTDAVRNITGIGPEVLVPLSNRGLAPAALADVIKAEVAEWPTILFTDLPSGSCGVAARVLARGNSSLIVICGVNLPMLLDFVTHREMPMEDLVDRLVARGRASISSSSASGPYGDSSLSR